MDNKGSPIAKRLKEARLKAGLSQKQLGIKAGIDQFSASPRINQYERGKHKPDFSIIERLAAALDVPTPYLYAADEQMAEVILLFGRLSARKQRRFISELRQTVSSAIFFHRSDDSHKNKTKK